MKVEKLVRNSRRFVPENFEIDSWEIVEPYLIQLVDRSITSTNDLREWFRDWSELDAVLSENLAWRYIKMTCDTTDEEAVKSYQFFISEIAPKAAPYDDKLNRKALDSAFINDLKDSGYKVMIRGLRRAVEIFREENIPLNTEIQTESQNYGQISGAMMVEVNNQELTLQQAGVLLQSADRKVRESVYYKISGRRLQDSEQLDELFTKLISLRHKVAENANFDNYRDYMFSAMGRFDYSPQDCFDFHNSVSEEVVPLLDELSQKRKGLLSVDKLRPWDKAVDPTGKDALKPFGTGEELLRISTEVFSTVNPYLGERLAIMKEMGHLDLESRKGKAPGGYNYPLAEIGVPFIFMNATSTLRDMVTLMHEGGHAVHSFLTKDLELSSFKHTPSEVAELASMSMELISMDYWHLFFKNEDDLRRAKREHLEQIIETLPWVATIDNFQHWIYENPEHSIEDRKENWNKIFNRYSDKTTDWSGLQDNKDYMWQKQLHLYEVPFYYIEYGMAQLGAIAVWKNFRENQKEGLAGYLNALKLGYTVTIPEIYEAANIRFDFSRGYIKELIGFIKSELGQL
jgi:oligoendopeptidase F